MIPTSTPRQLKEDGFVWRDGCRHLEGIEIYITKSHASYQTHYYRYELNMYLLYLPVYLWTVDCRRRGVNMFWELLTLISQCEGEKLLDLKTIVKEKTKPDTDHKIPCLYCGENIKQKKLKKHLSKCCDKYIFEIIL